MRVGACSGGVFAAAACLAAAFARPDTPRYDVGALIKLARHAVTAEVAKREPPTPDKTTPARPVFVTIERKGVVLGCRGSLVVRSESLEGEVVAAARAAAAHDPRYRPLSPADLNGFLVTVTIVERQEAIHEVDGLKPEDGLVLVSGDQTGVVLPWEGKDPHVRLDWAYRKAGVSKGAKVALYRLIAQRFRG